MAFSMVDDSSSNSSSQFATMFHKALTTLSCGSGGSACTTTTTKSASLADLDCLGLLAATKKGSPSMHVSSKSAAAAARRRRRGVTVVAHQEARKILSLLSEQMSASKAILLDAETISIVLERLLA